MIELINGNCFEELEKLIKHDVKVDVIITDPPFLHVKGGMKSKRINTGAYKKDSYINTKMNDFCETNIYNLLNLSKKIFNGSFNGYFFCSKLQIVSYLKWHKKINLTMIY